MDEVVTASLNAGPVGARFRKWLKKTVRPNDDGIELAPKALRDGVLVYRLTPIRAKSGEIVRLKQDVFFTPKGIEYLHQNLPAPPGTSLH